MSEVEVEHYVLLKLNSLLNFHIYISFCEKVQMKQFFFLHPESLCAIKAFKEICEHVFQLYVIKLFATIILD